MQGTFRRHPLMTAVVFTIMGVLPLYLTAAQTVAIQRDLGFGPSRFGFVVSSFFLVSSVASKRVGPRIDREGPTRALRIAAALTVVASTLVVLAAHSWLTLAIAIAVAGLANAYGQVGANTIIAHLVRTGRQAVSFSAKQSAVPLSAMISGAVVPLVGQAGGWRWAYGAVAVLAFVLFFATPGFEGAAPSSKAPAPGPPRRMTPALLALMVAVAFAGGIGNAAAAFAPDAAVDAGFSTSVAALLLTGGSLLAIIVRISAGLNADRRDSTGFLETTSLITVGIAGLTVLSLAAASRPLFLIGLMLMFAGAWGWQGVIAYMALRTIDLPAATSTGAVWSGVYLGTVIAPSVVGVLVERLSYSLVFAGQAGLMLVSLVCVTISRVLSRREGPAGAGSRTEVVD